jgi:arginine decarboxylase
VQDWDIAEARAAYSIAHWGSRYFDIGAEGHLQVTPRPGRDETRIDLHRVTDHLEANGLSLPVLVRFTDILQDRVHQLREAFTRAMSDSEYLGGYAPVYPIKVNQQRRVVEAIFGSGDVGLETGSKPELMAVLGLATHDTLIVCNGYKDREYVRLALIGEQLGSRIFIVLEKLGELELVLDEARALGVTPRLGVRLQLASTGRGKWENSGGERSKFGLPASDVLQVVERLRAEGMGRGTAARRGHERRAAADARPPRLPDRQHPRHPPGIAGGRTLLRRVAQARRAADLHRRRWRSRDRLRGHPLTQRI